MRLTFTLLTFLLVSTFGLAQNVKFNDTFDDDKKVEYKVNNIEWENLYGAAN